MSSHRFGVCPHCGGTDGYLNVGAYHVFLCDLHKTWWQTTSHVLDWKHEDTAIWEANFRKIETYDEVKPKHNRSMAVYPVWKYGELTA